MPDKCCVPGCKSNYKKIDGGSYVSVFKFPKDEKQRTLWIKSIPRTNWEPRKFSVVCIKHFDTNIISKTEKYKDSLGVWREFPRRNPILLPGAIPSIFTNVPDYLHNEQLKDQQNPRKHRQERINSLEEKFNDWLKDDVIKDFETLTLNLNTQLNLFGEFLVNTFWHRVVFYKCNWQTIPSITVSVKVTNEMICTVYVDQNQLSEECLDWVLPNNLRITRWSQLQNILVRYKDVNAASQYPLEPLIIPSKGELIHKCRRCEKGFAKRDNLSKHLKTNCQSKSETVECKPDIPDLGINYKENAASFRDSKKTATTSTAVTPTNAASSNFEISNNETVKTIIKEEIDADEDDSIYSPTVSRDGDQMEFEDSFIDDQEPTEDPLADNSSDIKFNIHQRRPAKNVATEKVANASREKADKSTNTEKFQGLSNILGIADLLALDIENILTDDICNFFEVNPMQSRRQIPRPTSDKEPTLSDLKSKCAELELKLRIHYLKDMIKHEEEISNLKKEVNRLQIVKEKMEIENNRDAHLQRMENLKLEHALLNLHLLNRAK